MDRLYFAPLASPFGRIWALKTEKGLVRLILPPTTAGKFDPGPSQLASWRDNYEPGYRLMESPSRLKDLEQWLKRYLEDGDPQQNIPLDLRGTPFQKKVWAIVKDIPYGHTVTYGSISVKLSKKSTSSRAVGSAVGANPVPLIVPCHRVIGENGKLVGFRSGLKMKQDLLRREGVLLL